MIIYYVFSFGLFMVFFMVFMFLLVVMIMGICWICCFWIYLLILLWLLYFWLLLLLLGSFWLFWFWVYCVLVLVVNVSCGWGSIVIWVWYYWINGSFRIILIFSFWYRLLFMIGNFMSLNFNESCWILNMVIIFWLLDMSFSGDVNVVMWVLFVVILCDGYLFGWLFRMWVVLFSIYEFWNLGLMRYFGSLMML